MTCTDRCPEPTIQWVLEEGIHFVSNVLVVNVNELADVKNSDFCVFPRFCSRRPHLDVTLHVTDVLVSNIYAHLLAQLRIHHILNIE